MLIGILHDASNPVDPRLARPKFTVSIQAFQINIFHSKLSPSNRK